MKRVLLLDEKTLYGFNSQMIRALARGFNHRGFEPVVIDLAKPDWPVHLHEFHKERSRFALVFSAGRGLVKIDGRYIHEHFDIPLFLALADHPLYKEHFIDFRVDTVAYGFTDPSQVEFCRSRYGGDRYVHFPHFSMVRPLDDLDESTFRSREKSLFFPASAAIMSRSWSVNIFKPVDSALVRALEERRVPIAEFVENFVACGLTLDTALAQFLEEHGSRFDPALTEEDFSIIFREIDVLIRALRRRHVLSSLEGFPITVMGLGWEACEYLGPSVTVLPPADYLACEEARSAYQVTLHTSHGQPYASHDRVLHAAAIGQAVLADRTPFMEELAERGCVAVYSIEAEDVREVCSKLLADDSLRFEMARAAIDHVRSAESDPKTAAGLVIDAMQRRRLL